MPVPKNPPDEFLKASVFQAKHLSPIISSLPKHVDLCNCIGQEANLGKMTENTMITNTGNTMITCTSWVHILAVACQQ